MIPSKRELKGIRDNVYAGIQRLRLKGMFEPSIKMQLEEIIEKDFQPALQNLDYVLSTM